MEMESAMELFQVLVGRAGRTLGMDHSDTISFEANLALCRGAGGNAGPSHRRGSHMSYAADRQTGGAAPSAPLVDVSEMSVRNILGEESALAGALERLAWETASGEDLFTAFGNFAPDDEPCPPVTSERLGKHSPLVGRVSSLEDVGGWWCPGVSGDGVAECGHGVDAVFDRGRHVAADGQPVAGGFLAGEPAGDFLLGLVRP